MHPELIVFDCDGVLVDSEVIVIEVEADLVAAGGFPITADEIAERYVGLSYPDMVSGRRQGGSRVRRRGPRPPVTGSATR